MPYCGNLLRALLLAGLLLLAGPAAASDVELKNPQLTAADDGYALSADVSIEFGPRLEEAVAKGVVLYFVADFELTRPRWYWLDEKVASRSQTLRLSYHALTRQYRLSTGALHQNFAALDDALRMLSHLHNWQVLDKGVAKAGETYLASLRLRLDLTQLPKPFQITALANKDWNLDSDWLRWSFVAAEGKALPAESKSVPAEGKAVASEAK